MADQDDDPLVAMDADIVSKDEIARAIRTLAAIADAIRELGSVPSGHLYSRLQDRFTLGQYEAILRRLTEARLIKVENHLVTWIGPEKDSER